MQALVLLPAIRVSLRLRGFGATQRFLQSRLNLPIPPPSEAVAGMKAEQVCRMVLAAPRHSFFPSTCLERSLALWWLLARRGIASQLRIGARKNGEQFEAHAWVERNGLALGEPEAAHLHYASFESEFYAGS